ncbi:MAG: zinc ribbon domain-containing protein [Anaerolineae bacterium]|nr:zinc ribbon domain-containing protein [Anaerolineae bacterium]
MPIYEYRCHECGEKFEKFVRSMNNPEPEIKCPECGGQKVKKLLSVFGIQTSGSTSEPICPTCMPRR